MGWPFSKMIHQAATREGPAAVGPELLRRTGHRDLRRATWTGIPLLALSALLAGCTTIPGSERAAEITAEDLLQGEVLGGPSDQATVSEDEILALDPRMIRWVEHYVDIHADPISRLNQLLYAMIGKGTFGLEYDDSTHSASETYRTRRGNCLSFTNLFVAMARHVNLDANFQEVEIPPDWTRKDNTFMLNRHVNVLVRIGERGKQVVDFNIEDFRTTYDRRKVSDERAMAHFYNNMGVQNMQEGDPRLALSYFRKAILDNNQQFSPAWSNLGTLYLSQGYPRHAEAAYLKALEVYPNEYVAMSNLARLYEQTGDSEKADFYNGQVASHRMKNPYYRYQLAREAFFSHDYETAIKHLKLAIRKKQSEDSFYFLLGLSYRQLGEQAEAEVAFEKAQFYADANNKENDYRGKLDLLKSMAE